MHILNIMQYMHINLLEGEYNMSYDWAFFYIIWKFDQTKNEMPLNKCSEDVQQKLFYRLLPIYFFTTRDTWSSAGIFNKKTPSEYTMFKYNGGHWIGSWTLLFRMKKWF